MKKHWIARSIDELHEKKKKIHKNWTSNVILIYRIKNKYQRRVVWAFFSLFIYSFVCFVCHLLIPSIPSRPMHAWCRGIVKLYFNPFFSILYFLTTFGWNNSQKKHSATSINSSSNNIQHDIDDSMLLIPNATATHQTKMTNNGTTNGNQTQTIDKFLFEKMSLHRNRNSFNIETIALLFMFTICAIIYSSKCSNFFDPFFPLSLSLIFLEMLKLNFEYAMNTF